MSSLTRLPPFGVVATALRRTTELLARELVQPSAAAPDWSPFEWDAARAVSTMQGITVLLARRLRWRGPSAWQDFLGTQQRLALQRDARIESLLTKIDAALRAAHVSCVGLKGSALRRLTLYRAGERPMGDVDLLARPADANRVGCAIQTLDYAASYTSRRHQVFAPRASHGPVEHGEHPDNPLKIEVHFRIAEPLPVDPVDITRGLQRDTPDDGIGLRDYPAPRELFRHLLLHAAGNMRAHALRQVQLHDIALMAGRLDSEDWDRLLDSPVAQGGSWWIWPVLELTQRYYEGSLPTVVDSFRERTPRWLRRTAERQTLTDLSWSNLRIAAFPGIHWARSPGEALRFALGRVLPERAALDELRHLRIAQPAMMQTPWYGISHARRILRWLVSRPPRVQTLNSVLVALGAGRQE